MAKRRTRVKLSKAQTLENDTNKWLAKRDAAIVMLGKAMDHLKECDQRSRRLQKAMLKPKPVTVTPPVPVTKPKRKPKVFNADKVKWTAATGPVVAQTTDIPNSEIFGDPGPIDREAHMKSLGFRPTKKRKTVAGEVAKVLGETLR